MEDAAAGQPDVALVQVVVAVPRLGQVIASYCRILNWRSVARA